MIREEALRHDCQKCMNLHDPSYRRINGCDEDTASPQAVITCPACYGAKTGCSHCNETGRVEYHACPRRVMDADTMEFVRVASMVECGILPNGGGWCDQTNAFTQAYYHFSIVSSEQTKARIDREAKQRERKAKQEAASRGR